MSNTEALRTAAQQALEAMQYTGMDVGKFNRINAACRALREALAQPAASGEPDMRHPKIQALIGGKARREIELRLVEQLLDDPDCDLSAMDMEYWHGLHDKLKDKLKGAQPAPAPAALEKSMQRECTDPRACTFHRYCKGNCCAPLVNANTALKLRTTDARATAQPVPARVPLTEDRLYLMADEAETPAWGEWYSDYDALLRFARAIEAAHGITAHPKEQQP